jgi:hypothetical protein
MKPIFSSRPITEIKLRNLLEHRSNAIKSNWSPYTVAEINYEIDRRQKRI